MWFWKHGRDITGSPCAAAQSASVRSLALAGEGAGQNIWADGDKKP